MIIIHTFVTCSQYNIIDQQFHIFNITNKLLFETHISYHINLCKRRHKQTNLYMSEQV
jgi:hypothetical protein